MTEKNHNKIMKILNEIVFPFFRKILKNLSFYRLLPINDTAWPSKGR